MFRGFKNRSREENHEDDIVQLAGTISWDDEQFKQHLPMPRDSFLIFLA